MKNEDIFTRETVLTTDHRVIRTWIEARGGEPAEVKAGSRGRDDVGALRVVFEEKDGKNAIGWDAFFRKFDQAHLAFLYQEKDGHGAVSRFFKFISCNGES